MHLTLFLIVDEVKPVSDVASLPHELTNECRGHWKTPRDCSETKHNCEYFASWETVGRGDLIHFHIETTNVKTWTGIGFSDDQKMVNI